MWNYTGGYVMIQVDGFAPRNFINQCNQSGIALYDIGFISDRKVAMRMRASDFMRLRTIARAAHCKVKITGKQGWVFRCRFLAGRPMLILGFFLFLAALWYGSTLIWVINIEGAGQMPPEQIRELVQKQGVDLLMKRADLNMGALERALELASPQIAWAGARINGAILTIDIIPGERFAAEQVALPCDIIATKDAVIQQITTLRGIEKVVPNQSVRAGDLLIGGILPAYENAPERYVNAKGSVVGSVWYIGTATVERTTLATARTGRFETVKIVQFADQPWELGATFQKYEIAEQSEVVIQDQFIPLRVVTQKRYELGETTLALTDQELTEQVVKKARENVYQLLNKNAIIVMENENVVLRQTNAFAQYVVQTHEDIASARLFENLPQNE